MLCTTAINTSNAIKTPTGAAERYSSGRVGILIRVIICLTIESYAIRYEMLFKRAIKS